MTSITDCDDYDQFNSGITEFGPHDNSYISKEVREFEEAQLQYEAENRTEQLYQLFQELKQVNPTGILDLATFDQFYRMINED
jgi:hypothetical protein